MNSNTKKSTSKIIFTEKTFQEKVFCGSRLVIALFFTERHGSCHIIEPIINEMVEHFSNKIKLIRIDADLNNSIIITYRIDTIPTLLFFRKGEAIDQISGTFTKGDLEEKIRKLLAKNN